MKHQLAEHLRKAFRALLAADPSRASVEHPELIDSSAQIKNSSIRGMVRVGARSKIVDAVIRGDVTIGRNTTFNGPNSDIFARINEVRIGSFCSIARDVHVQEYNHQISRLSSYFIHGNVFGMSSQDDITSKGNIVIGNDVWIGTGTVILSGVTIGDGAVIGANSVVTTCIPPYAIAVGAPCDVIKYRFSPDTVSLLQSVGWWDWELERLIANKELFSIDDEAQLRERLADFAV